MTSPVSTRYNSRSHSSNSNSRGSAWIRRFLRSRILTRAHRVQSSSKFIWAWIWTETAKKSVNSKRHHIWKMSELIWTVAAVNSCKPTIRHLMHMAFPLKWVCSNSNSSRIPTSSVPRVIRLTMANTLDKITTTNRFFKAALIHLTLQNYSTAPVIWATKCSSLCRTRRVGWQAWWTCWGTVDRLAATSKVVMGTAPMLLVDHSKKS